MNTTTPMDRDTPEPAAEQAPARIVAGALAHLARHMETGCQRSAYLAAMLLEKVASDPEADDHLRRHARELVEILDRDGDHRLEQRKPAVEQSGTTGEEERVLMGFF